MLVKVGRFYLTLGTFIYDAEAMQIMQQGQSVQLTGAEAATLQSFFCDAIAAQQSIDDQVKLQKEVTEKLNSEIARIAAYEKDLMAKAAQVDAAYAAMQQQKSPVILPPGFGAKRGRG